MASFRCGRGDCALLCLLLCFGQFFGVSAPSLCLLNDPLVQSVVISRIIKEFGSNGKVQISGVSSSCMIGLELQLRLLLVRLLLDGRTCCRQCGPCASEVYGAAVLCSAKICLLNTTRSRWYGFKSRCDAVIFRWSGDCEN